MTAEAAEALLHIDVVVPENGQARPPEASVTWVYALAAPFNTLTDEVRLEALIQAWKGRPDPSTPFTTLLVDESTRGVFSKLWGEPGAIVQTTAAGDLLQSAWDAADTWAIVPFEKLEPRWKVIAVDEQNPVQKAFDPTSYGLTVYFGSADGSEDLSAERLQKPLAESNRKPDRLTTVMLTGVTALVRGTASWMEYFGNEYPAMFIGDELRDADILHINNEVPFAANCPYPYPWEGLVFCSRTKYMELLDHIGADVIELSGDHLHDWGEEATYLTINMIQERGLPYYGGGLNREDAQKPALFEHNGNKIAFLGCNAKPPGYSSASETTPGAVHCDFDQLVGEIQRVRAQGYLPIVTFQHLEYYSYNAHPILEADFKRVAEAGAVIVSGSQAHQPHAMAFLGGDPSISAASASPSLSFLHYGLGNLFFDQVYEGYPNRQAFIDRHVFFEGRHISTELLTILFVDLARARPMTDDERLDLLSTIFEASGWQPNQ